MNANGRSRICFFAGPSISSDVIRAECAGVDAEIELMPPVQQGDLLRMIDRLPDVLCIIDGYFHQVPAVLHKEILLVLERGARVLGAASLGALRAVELDSFGMEGVGEIYRLFKQGHIDGDDEVAVVQAAQEDGFRPLTEPLVNIRHQLHAARTREIISARTAAVLLASAKRLHFTERTIEAVLRAAAARVESLGELAAFRNFVETESFDLKREDALALVRTVAARVRGTEAWPPRVPLRVNKTKYLRILERDYVGHASQGRHVPDTVVLSFQKLLSDSFPDLFRRVGLRCLAVDEALDRGFACADAESLRSHFRRSRGLRTDSAYDEWLKSTCLSEDELIAILREFDLEERLFALYRTEQAGTRPDSAMCDRVLADVVARTGLTEQELTEPPFMRPGILWEGPLVRDSKLRGDFRSSLELAGRILQFESELFGGNAQLKLTFDSLIVHACDRLERWVADRWRIAANELEKALRKRGFVRHREFLEVARSVYVYETHGPGSVFTQSSSMQRIVPPPNFTRNLRGR